MTLDLWLAFVATYTIISILPGPSVLMVTGQALLKGKTAAFLCILGDLLGGVVLVALSLLGVGAVLAASSDLFSLVKWAGVMYMAYLGFRHISDARKEFAEATDTQESPQVWGIASVRAGFVTAVLNPKAIVFYVAFLSQFLDPTKNIHTQFAIVLATSTLIVATVLGGYAVLAVQARNLFQSRTARKGLGYAGGGFLIGGSILMATTR